ncbi:hypothetical protein C0J52_07022 [Blattella germanica]|nr:hypothetical protein C0J52_07022 [Blattella germanica]
MFITTTVVYASLSMVCFVIEMPPVIIKTYQHKPKKKKRPWAAICNIHDRKDGEDPKTTFDTLFSENIKQQKKILKEKKNIKVKYSSPVPKKAPLRFTSTDDEGAFESTFDRILKAPVLQQAEPLDVNKNSDFASSSSDMRSSSSEKNTKSRAGEEPPVLRRSRASLKKINKETNKDSCLTSTPMMKKCENKLYVALSPVQGTRINTLSNRALKDNNSIVSSRTRSHLKMSIRKSKMGAHGYVSTVFCDENNESPERISNENVQVSEMSECVSSLENLRLETSRNEFLFSKVVSTLKNPEKLQVEHNESMLKESNGELSNEVQTSLNIDTTNNVQKNSDEAAQRLNSPVMFDSWDAGKKNSLRASSGACDMVEPRNVASGPNGLLLDFKGFEDEETTAAASSAVALLSYFDLSKEICSNEMLGDSFVKSSFNRLPCRRQSLMVVPSDVMISRFKLPSFSDVYRKTIHQNSTTNLETNFTKSETEEDEDGDGDRNGKISLSDSLLAGTSTLLENMSKDWRRELSNLRHGEENRTQCFSEMKRCLCVKGKYPEHLIRLWNDYDDLKGETL